MDQFDSQSNLKIGFIKAILSKKILRTIIYTFAIIATIIALALGGLLIRLAISPINLDFLRPHLESPIGDLEKSGITLKFGEIKMVWNRWFRPYEIVISDVEICDSICVDQALQVPEIGFSFYIDDLFLGEISIKTIYIYEPSLTLDLGQDEGIALKINGNGESKPLDLESIYPYLTTGQNADTLGAIDYISKIKIVDAKLTIKEQNGNEYIKLPRLTLSLNRYKDGFRIQAEIRPRQAKLFSESIKTELRHRIGSDKMDFNLKLTKANLSHLIKSDIETQARSDTTLNQVLEVLDAIDTTWNGDLHLSISPETFNVFEGSLAIESGAGTLLINQEKAVIEGIKFHGHVGKNSLKLTVDHFNPEITKLNGDITYNFPDTYLNLTTLVQAGGKIAANFKLSDLRASDLDKLWPQKLAPITRKWVTDNITDGLVNEGEFSLETTADYEGKFAAPDYKARLNVEDATIHYFGELPPLLHVFGIVEITPDIVSIDTSSGMVENLKMTKGIVHINDLKDTPGMLVADMSFEGKLEDVLKVIDHKPLEHPKKAHIDLNKTRGHGHADLLIHFDLDENNKNDDLKIEASGEFFDIETFLDIKKLPITYSADSASISIKDGKLLITSKGVLNKLSSSVRIDAFVDNKKTNPWSVKVTAGLTPTVVDFKEYGFDYTYYAEGDLPTSITYTQINDKKSKLDMDIDMSKSYINVKPIGWIKEVGAKGDLAISASMIDGTLTVLDKFSLNDDFLNADGIGSFSAKGDLNVLNLVSLRAPKTDASVQIEWLDNSGYRLSFAGNSVNAEDFMKFLDEEKSGQTDHAPIPIEIKSNVNNLIMGDGKAFTNVESDVMIIVSPGNVDWKFVHLSTSAGVGKAQGHKGRMADTTGGISLDISKPDHNDVQNLEVRANDAGQLFRNLGLYEQVSGGRMVIKASRKVGYPFEGSFKLKEFDATGIPIVGRMAAALSPSGIVNLFSSDNRIYINDFRCDFIYGEDLVSFWNGAGKSLSIGFSTKGKMDRISRTFDVKGEIIPAYVINSVLDNIPILGSLLNGGQNSGLFAVDYTVKGSFDEPIVDVNPLTALAPGFIKNLFDWSE